MDGVLSMLLQIGTGFADELVHLAISLVFTTIMMENMLASYTSKLVPTPRGNRLLGIAIILFPGAGLCGEGGNLLTIN